MNMKKISALTLDIIIVLLAVVCAVLTYQYIEMSAFRWGIWIVLVICVVGILIWELRGTSARDQNTKNGYIVPCQLALIGEDERKLRTWPLDGKAGFLVGKSEGEVLADIDLAACSWSVAIDAAHLAVNFADGGWWAQDLSSRNGSAILRNGKEILLVGGCPIEMQHGDTILLAGNIRLAVQ